MMGNNTLPEELLEKAKTALEKISEAAKIASEKISDIVKIVSEKISGKAKVVSEKRSGKVKDLSEKSAEKEKNVSEKNVEKDRPFSERSRRRTSERERRQSSPSQGDRHSQGGRHKRSSATPSDIARDLLIKLSPVLIILALIIILSGTYSKIIKRKVWLNHTKVNGQDVSGKTIEETLDILPDGADYSLTISGRGGARMTIRAGDIDYQIHVDEEKMKKDFRGQHKLIVFPWSSYKYYVDSSDGYNEEKLKELLDNCELIKGSDTYTITAPVSADIVYSKEKKAPEIKKEVYGNTLKKKEFYQAVKDALESGLQEIELFDKESYPSMYEEPRVTSDSEELQKGLKDYNSYIHRYISWEMWEGETFTITPKQIVPLVYYSEGKMSYRVYKLEAIINKFCEKYQTAGKERIFTTHKGKKVRIKKGDYGWKLDFNKTLDQAETALTKELDYEAVKRVMDDPSEENKKAVTITLKPQYKTEASLKDYENYQDWDPNNYTEASISEQMIYVHRDGKIAFSCKTISGLPVEGRETGKGVFYVKGRSLDRVLRGPDYETPVKYWIRLTNSGTGFHSAPWQKWNKWSPTYYKKHGSHGCLNLSEKNAKKMYEIIKDGEAVFIY